MSPTHTSVPPLAPTAAVTTGPRPAELATVRRRVAQFLLDVALVGLVGLGVWALEHGRHLAAWFPVPYPGVQNVAIPALYVLVLVVVPVLAGRTPGMAVLGMRVRRAEDRGRVAAVPMLVRGILTWLDALLLGLVGIVVMGRTPQRQRLGDVVARTVVERTR